MKPICKLLLLLCVVAQAGCVSYVYSPSLNLSEKQLEQGELDLKAGAGLLPETSRRDPNTTIAGGVDVGYGFTKGFNLYAGTWADLESEQGYRGGISLASRIRVMENGNNQLLIHPKIMMLNGGNAFDAYGFELPLIFVRSFTPDFYAYAGLGYGYGQRDGEYSDQSVVAAVGHIGLGWKFSGNFRMMLELNPIYQHNDAYDDDQYIFAPTISIGYLFNSPQNREKFFEETKR